MTDALSTLAWKLKAWTGLDVYPAPKPVGASVPCLTFQMVTDPIQDNNNMAGGSIHKSRVQINHIGDYETIRPYVETVRTNLEGDRTDFLSAQSTGVYFENKEAEDLWMLTKEYFIQWRS